MIQEFEKQNFGLSSRFQLTPRGGFALIGGKPKADDGVSMFLAFAGWFRIFTQDYVINPYAYFQNTTTYMYQFKNIFRLKILEAGKKYVPFSDFISVDMPLNFQNRKESAIYIQFKYNLTDSIEQKTIKRVIL